MSPEEATIAARIEIERLIGTHGAELDNVVQRAQDRLMRELAQARLDPERYTDAVRLEQMNKLNDRFKKILYGERGTGGTYKVLSNATRKIAPTSFRAAYRLARDELKGQVQASAFPMIKQETAAFMALHQPRLSGLMDRFHADLYDQVTRKIQEGVILGRNPEVIARDLVNTGLPRGRFNVARTRARLIARTEVPRALNAGKITNYKKVGVGYVKIVGGTSVCEQCAVYHGNVYRLEEAPVFPLHPRCTHTYIPIDRNGVGIGFTGELREDSVEFVLALYGLSMKARRHGELYPDPYRRSDFPKQIVDEMLSLQFGGTR